MAKSRSSKVSRKASATDEVAPSLIDRAFAPVDIAPLIFFRVLVASFVLWMVCKFFAKGWIGLYYIEPECFFTYYGFEWVRPWPGNWMYLHFAAVGMCAVCVMVGVGYRLAAIGMWLGFTYIFLCDKSLYLNHYYFLSLLCFLLVVLPAGRSLSIDTWRNPEKRMTAMPKWILWLLRFQISLPYVFGGVAKLSGDWLRGQPMGIWLSVGPLPHLFGSIFQETWMALAFSWGGVCFDLGIVPLLLWHRTRRYAILPLLSFHLLNAVMFDIGIFPWMMLAATLIYFPPEFVRSLIPQFKKLPEESSPTFQRSRTTLGLVGLYVLLQLILPFRHYRYPGDVNWHEQGRYFSWYMMARTKVVGLQVNVYDRVRQKRGKDDPNRWLTPIQLGSVGKDPDMLREYAHFVREQYAEIGADVEVYVVAPTSLNGRKPQLAVDPTVDLSRQERTLTNCQWIPPLTEPFRWEPWDIPMVEWHQHVEMPQ